jgi:hypothetical protein
LTGVCPVETIWTAGDPDIIPTGDNGSFIDPGKPETTIEFDCRGGLTGIESESLTETNAGCRPVPITVCFSVPDIIPCRSITFPENIQLIIVDREARRMSGCRMRECGKIILVIGCRSGWISTGTYCEAKITAGARDSPTDPETIVASISKMQNGHYKKQVEIALPVVGIPPRVFLICLKAVQGPAFTEIVDFMPSPPGMGVLMSVTLSVM